MSIEQPRPGKHRALIGPRLRHRRHELGLTLDEVAEASGLTKSFLSAVERDQTSPSVASLLMICDVLRLPVGSLFDSSPDAVVRVADRRPIEFGGAGLEDFLISPKGTNRFQAVLSEMAPGAGGGDELYSLRAAEVFVMVLAGRVVLRFADESQTLAVGDTMTYEPKRPHTFDNASATEAATALFIIMPALA